MEAYSLTLPNEKQILYRRKYVINDIVPLAIRIIDNHRFIILFLAGETNEENNILLQSMYEMNRRDEVFIKAHPLYIENLPQNKQKLDFYIEATKDATKAELFVTDFKMTRDPKSFYFLSYGFQKISNKEANVLDLYFTKDNFIKINIFLRRFSIYDKSAEVAFVDKKLNNIEFSTIEEVYLDASTTDLISKIVCNHYTMCNGAQTYKFNFISPKIPDRVLKKPLPVETYNDLFLDNFVISDMIYCDDKLYIIYEERSDITNKYKKTLALILSKDLYNETNLIDFSKIYKEEEK